MPFGVKSAPEVFQKHLTHALQDLNGVLVCADDVLVVGYGETPEEIDRDHDQNCRKFLERCQEKNIRLNAKKLKFKQDEIVYMGHHYSVDGMSPDPSKVSAVKDMMPPKDQTQLRSFLSTIAYLARYLPKLSTVSEPLRRLQKKNVPFEWSSECQLAFDQIKDMVTAAPILQYYDPTVPVTIQCNASEYGLGAALLQKNKPVCFASRPLTSTEKNYAQIEKEMLAIVFATHRFDHLIYGLPEIQIHTDHKPLQAIMHRSINEAPNKRLQKMILHLQRYPLQVHYVPGKEMWIADTLSRQISPDQYKTTKQSVFAVKLELHQLHHDLAITSACKEDILKATSEDETLQHVRMAIQSGDWSSPVIGEYLSSKKDLSTQDGLIFKSAKLVIPRALRSRMLKELHASHSGIETTRRRAREICYWPNMNAQITDLIKKCEACNALQPSQPREELHQHEVPEYPWLKVGMDIFECEGRQYLIMSDYTSNWFEICDMPRITASAVINECRKQFARHGVPLKVMADSGTQFTSFQFREFAKKWNFEIEVSSPYHHQSNGKAENAVKTAKQILHKCAIDGSDPLLAILEWRNSPSGDTGTSPAQRLFSRRCRTTLPINRESLKPNSTNTNDLARLWKAKSRQANNYNRQKKNLSDLQPGQNVSLQVPGTTSWIPGEIIRKLPYRAYEVMANDTIYR